MSGMHLKRRLSVWLLLAAVVLAAVPVFAEPPTDRSPLLQAGKKTLFQRVLTRPGAMLTQQPGGDAGRLVDAFSRFYVYAETERDGQRWLEVGVDTKGKISGWLRAGDTVPWLQQMALAFTNPGAARERALFYDSWDSLNGLLALSDPAAEVGPLTRKIAEGGRDPRVVAIEPDRFIDINSRFYLLPILDFEEVFTDSGHLMRGLKVASVTETAAPTSTPLPDERAEPVTQLGSFRAAVVFIIDSTVSMQQYIDEARAAAQQVYTRIEGSGLLDKVSFGLVAFRAPTADPAKAKSLEYVARMFVDPAEVSTGLEFLTRASKVTEAKVSTDRFDEDPYAGVITALEEIPWNRFGARYAVLITDAGALEGDASTTGLHAEQVRSEAAEKGVALMVLHLKTALGKANHATAEAQYRTLANNAAIQRSLYFSVKDGSAAALGKAVSALSDTVIESIEASARGDLAAGSARAATSIPSSATATASPSVAQDPETAALREATRVLGHAMQLAYLGREEGTLAPSVFEGWISDSDLADPTVRTVDERVLITKDQLSDLHGILKQIVDAADAGMLKPDAFFDSLRSIAAQYGRDPALAASPQATQLADLGLLGEYLDGLPYKSDVMTLDQDTWSRWGTQRQFEFVSRLKGKIKLYERYNADTDRWVSLAEGSPAGEWVYPVPLRDLP
ncbi:vWA domain-containing protein [Thiocapsa sp.]|uniref:vWA domain-containing protein n=1 Tax=Thiocapsa sp. TaxID=2024551 RepID=UPI002C31CB7E|nr:vWA domain-containing protein [Thiocapsa sp.]HSO81296.1 vWA domain-containing protein [Thiocapsa sp.]